jgi:hypothetical protein
LSARALKSFGLGAYECNDILRLELDDGVVHLQPSSTFSEKSRCRAVVMTDGIVSEASFPSQVVDKLFQQLVDRRSRRK